MYKYSCRDCRVRERCIDQHDSANHIKTMIRTAFAARTDTLSMWAILQKSCLLVQDDEERERKASEGSILSRRLREVKEAKEESDGPAVEDVVESVSQTDRTTPIIPPSPEPSITVASDLSDEIPVSPSTMVDVEEPEAAVFQDSLDESTGTRSLELAQLDQPPIAKGTGYCRLIIDQSQRHISLPGTGELILGRFDPQLTEPLDVDLTYEDRDTLSVSRRHALIEGVDGHHTIEDLGSANGVYVNGEQIKPGRVCPLQPGDQIVLGRLNMGYEFVPAEFLSTLRTNATQIRHFLLVTHTGRKVELALPDRIIIGRSDPSTNFLPAVDLSRDGEVAYRVSRRHARISWTNRQPYLKDLTSTFGTRLNGERLFPDQSILLKPGDHMSLGGCVLAYDIEA